MKHSRFPFGKMQKHLCDELKAAVEVHNGKISIPHDEEDVQGELSDYYIQDGHSEEVIVDEIYLDESGSIMFKGRCWSNVDNEVEGDCSELDVCQLDSLLEAIPSSQEKDDVTIPFSF